MQGVVAASKPSNLVLLSTWIPVRVFPREVLRSNVLLPLFCTVPKMSSMSSSSPSGLACDCATVTAPLALKSTPSEFDRRLLSFTSTCKPIGLLLLMTNPDVKLMVAVRGAAVGVILQTLPAGQPAMGAVLSFLKVS